MNELLQKLAEQATEIIEVMGEEGNTNTHANFHVQKFAELIVRECSNFLKDTLDDHFAAEQLEEHFGVEE
jgi:hypothetical protein